MDHSAHSVSAPTTPLPGGAGDFSDLLQYADPETIQAMVDAGLIPAQMSLAQQHGQMGGMLQTPQPEGRQVGNVYVAASPLEHAAAAVRSGIGLRQMKDSMQHQGALIDQAGKAQGLGWQQMVNAIRGMGPAQPGPRFDPRSQGLPGPFLPGQGYPGMPDGSTY